MSTPALAPRRKAHAGTKARPLAEMAFERLRGDIIQCKLAPGSQVTEGGICDLYGFGKASVRAALARLDQEGLVRAVPRQGYIIAPITLKSVQEMYELRLLIEPALARMAAGRVDVALLRKLNVAPGASKAQEAELIFLQSNRNFHLAIAESIGNQRLLGVMAQLLDDMARLLHLGLFSGDWRSGAMRSAHEGQAQQHEDLIRAFARNDGDAAEKAARLHVEASRELVMKALHSPEALTIGRVPFRASR